MRAVLLPLVFALLLGACSKESTVPSTPTSTPFKDGWTEANYQAELQVCEADIPSLLDEEDRKGPICRCWLDRARKEITRAEFDGNDPGIESRIQQMLTSCASSHNEDIRFAVGRFLRRNPNEEPSKVRKILDKAKVKKQASPAPAPVPPPTIAPAPVPPPKPSAYQAASLSDALAGAEAHMASYGGYGVKEDEKPKIKKNVLDALASAADHIDAGSDVNAAVTIGYRAQKPLELVLNRADAMVQDAEMFDAWTKVGGKLIDKGAAFTVLTLTDAAQAGNAALTEKILAKGPTMKGQATMSLVDMARAMSLKGRQSPAAKSRMIETAEVLLKHGADVNTMLPVSIFFNQHFPKMDEVKKFLADNGVTDLSLIQSAAIESYEVTVDWLLEKGAKLTEKDVEIVRKSIQLCSDLYGDDPSVREAPECCWKSRRERRVGIVAKLEKIVRERSTGPRSDATSPSEDPLHQSAMGE